MPSLFPIVDFICARWHIVLINFIAVIDGYSGTPLLIAITAIHSLR